MEMEPPAPRVEDVLAFLTSRGLSRAAAALRDDLLAAGSAPPPPPPVRTRPSSSSSSSSSGDFLSMGSSPAGLLNPYGIWSPISSDRHSEFETARDYNDPNLFGDTNWYNYMNDPFPVPGNSGGCRSEDKFVMSVEDEGLFGNKSEHGVDVGGAEGCTEMCGYTFPLCDCCSGDAKLGSNSSIYGRYRIMADETERLDECDEDGFQLKKVDECPGANAWNGDSSHYPNNKELEKEDNDKQIHIEKASQLDANDDHELGKFGTLDKEFRDPQAVEIESEEPSTDELRLYTSQDDEYEIFDLRIVHRKNRTGFEENKDFKIILNSVIAGRYYVTEYLGSAAFSKVIQARDLHAGMDVCLKIIKNDKDFFDQSLDEIKLLKFVNKYDPADECHILRLYDYFYHQEHLFIVCELLRANLYEFQKYNQESGGEAYFTLSRIQAIARQCLEALEYLHHLRIIHCDLKPENILIKSYSSCEIKVIDLGSSCFQTDNLSLYVQSRSYRAPEVILGLSYDEKIDIWSLGCILAELYSGDVLFPNDSVVMMLARMIGIIGPIDMEMLVMGQETHKYFTDDYDLYHKNEEVNQVEYLIPEKSSLANHLRASDTMFIDFLSYLLQLNPKRRPTASQALQHKWLSFSYR